ncbi:MAG: SRPBCC family protein [Nitriliruptor sp.]
MSVARYRFVTDMRFAAPARAVYRSIVEPERWLAGWADAVTVRRTDRGDHDGRGASFEATVRAPVGYRLSARIETVAAERPRCLQMRASGDLDGTGTWRLRDHPDGTDVRFTWDVRTRERWMNLLTPVARPVFEWSHGVVMRHATEAAARDLGAELLLFRSRPIGRRRRTASIAVALAGCLAIRRRSRTHADHSRGPSHRARSDGGGRSPGAPWTTFRSGSG